MCRFPRLALAVVALLAGIALPFVFSGSRAVGSAPLSITISGNQFLDGNGNTVRLLGVNRPSAEYACYDGYGYASGADGSDPLSLADAQAIASWHANAVRIPLNEDCWLGINGLPASNPASLDLTSAGYQSAIESYVGDLNSLGIYAILDLHWSAPGMTLADGQRALPDAHSIDFWTSVAGAFKNDPAVLFDAFNEPYSPAANGNAGYPVTWSCWKSGGCTVPDANDQQAVDPTQTYPAVGMQQIVDAIRATGANQPILLGGLGYANDLTGWLANEPSDPRGQLAASFHNYTGESCATVSCWNSTIAPVAAQVPVVTGEFDEDCPASGDDPGNFDNTYMDWADQHGVSYLAWGWYVGAPPGCGGLFLISDWSGTPLDPNGVALHDHLAALAQTTAGGPTTSSTPMVPSGSTSSSSTPTSTSTSTPSTTPPAAAAGKLALRIRTLQVAHGRLTCSGVLARGFSGSLSVTVTVTVRGHGKHAHALRKTLRAKTEANAGRFRFTLRLPPGGALTQVTVSYAGGRYFAAGSTSKR